MAISMRALAGVGLCLACLATWGRAAEPLHVKVMSFNIRLSPANDGPDRWELRKEFVVDVIREYGGDFVGVQEAWADQIAYLNEQLPDYRSIARSRETDASTGEGTPLYYRHARWELDPREHGTFWLSDTPEEAGSRSWGNNLPRIVTWGRFIDKETGRGLYVVNTHFDHQSEPSRQNSAQHLARFLAERSHKEPLVVTGDFNSPEASYAVRYLTGQLESPPVRLIDTFRVAHPDATGVGTAGGFAGATQGPKIDYIFVLPGAEVASAEIVRSSREGRYPSDHFPVTAELKLPGIVE